MFLISVCNLCWKSNRIKTRQRKDYLDSFTLLYGNNTLTDCIAIIEAKENFYGLHSPGLSLDGFNTHKKLLHGYRKLHRAKCTKENGNNQID